MGIFSGKPGSETRADLFAERSRNGNVRDISSEHKHAAELGGHRAAVNDIRPSDHTGRHRAE